MGKALGLAIAGDAGVETMACCIIEDYDDWMQRMAEEAEQSEDSEMEEEE